MSVGDDIRFHLTTPRTPGAIAILQVHGPSDDLVRALTGRESPRPGETRLTSLADIDEGVIATVRPGLVQIMPHGGPRVVQRLTAALLDAGAVLDHAPDPMSVYPEAADRFEALALAAIARAESPLAVDLLLDQSAQWRERDTPTASERAASTRLNRLIDPPVVVVVGPPNVGKSTLSNTLVGREMSIASDRSGTTRDYTAASVNLGGLVVHWHDTPGLRSSDDRIEQEAILIARRLIDAADLLIAMTDPQTPWPDLPRADLRIASKADLGPRPDADLSLSATSGDGVNRLVTTVREYLVPVADLEHDGLWVFDPRLESSP